MLKNMKSRTIVGNCGSEIFFWCLCSSWLCSDSTSLNCYVRGSKHGIQNRLPIVAMLLFKDDPLIKAESMEILLVKLGAMEVLEGEGSSCEHNI